MFEVCFYDRSSYPKAHWWNRLVQWLISLFSKRYLHVDCRVAFSVLAADAETNSARLFNVMNWPEPAVVIQMPCIHPVKALQLFKEIEEKQLHYGWWDFLLIPFRKLIGDDGRGVICSELTGEVIHDLLILDKLQHWCSDCSVLAGRLEQAHKLTPTDIYNILADFADPLGFNVIHRESQKGSE